MKRILSAITLFLLLMPAVALADGPAASTVSGTPAGTKYVVQAINDNYNYRQFNLTATCVDDGFTVTAWRYANVGGVIGWRWTGTELGIANPDSAHAPASMILPIEGKFNVLVFSTDTIAADIDLLFYSE